MKSEERITKDFFKNIGYSNILFEPNGNIPPDFVIDGEIAIEVRRLNKHLSVGNKIVPIEDLKFKLIPKVEDLLRSFGSGIHQESCFVSIYYQRPLKVNRKLLNEISNVLEKHSSNMKNTKHYEINDNLSLRIIPSEVRLEEQFCYGSSVDFDGGGFILAAISDNLGHILREKEQKIIPYFDKFKTWWLVLVDHIGYGLTEEEINELEIKEKSNYFERIYFLGPKIRQGGYKLISNART